MKQNNQGFSLLELIVSIAIMAVLSGMMAPQFFKYIEKAREVRDLQTLQTVYTAVQTALADDEAYEVMCSSAVEYSGEDGEKRFSYCYTLEDVLADGAFGEEVEELLGTEETIDLISKKSEQGVICIKIIGESDGDVLRIRVYSGKRTDPEIRAGSLDGVGAVMKEKEAGSE